MLIRFNVSNFLSFYKRTNGKSEEFSLIGNNEKHSIEKDNFNILKFSAIYGANASGKSNFIKAITFFRTTILQGKISDKYYESYCKAINEAKTEKSYFEIEFTINDKLYSYGFEAVLSKRKFVSEWLFEHDSEREICIFERDIEKSYVALGDIFDNDAVLKNKLNVYLDDIKSDATALFLNVMNHNKRNLYKEHIVANVFKVVFIYFLKNIVININEEPISDYSYMIKNDRMDEVISLLNRFSTGISAFEKVEISFNKMLDIVPDVSIREDILSNIRQAVDHSNMMFVLRINRLLYLIQVKNKEIKCYIIKIRHENQQDVLYDLGEESDGTIRLLDLLEILLTDEEKIYVIDELDRGLHPILTYNFVKYFLANRNSKTQLLVTTHESRLLDFSLLTREEVWFVNRRADNTSDLYSLNEYNDCFDKIIDKAYLDGRYGGVPLFNSLFPVEGGI